MTNAYLFYLSVHANCVALAILIDTYQLVNDIPAHRGNACICICSITQQSPTSGMECHTVLVGSLVQLYKRLSQLALDLVASPASQAYVERLFSLCGDPISRKRNSTKVSLWRRVFLKLNSHILYWTQCTVNWSVTCFWYCRTAEDTLQILRFFTFTDLLT